MAAGLGMVEGFTTGHLNGCAGAEIRQRLGTSRKYALALLAYLDANGITRRREDVRIAGPRLTGPA